MLGAARDDPREAGAQAEIPLHGGGQPSEATREVDAVMGKVEISSCHEVDQTLADYGFESHSARGIYRCVGFMPQPDGRRYTVFDYGPLAALAKFNRLAADIAGAPLSQR